MFPPGIAITLLTARLNIRLFTVNIGAVAEYLTKRISAGQFEQKDCHILVNRDKGTIQLVFNEKDAYNRGEVLGSLVVNPKFEEFGINDADVQWTPVSLGLFFKMNRP